MKQRIVLSFALVAAFAVSGCVLHSRGHDHSRSAKACHPSQHWNGSQCVHNGKGHGARKHDGRKK